MGSEGGEEGKGEMESETYLVVLLPLLVHHKQLQALLPNHRLNMTTPSVTKSVWFHRSSLLLILSFRLVRLTRRLSLRSLPDVLESILGGYPLDELTDDGIALHTTMVWSEEEQERGQHACERKRARDGREAEGRKGGKEKSERTSSTLSLAQFTQMHSRIFLTLIMNPVDDNDEPCKKESASSPPPPRNDPKTSSPPSSFLSASFPSLAPSLPCSPLPCSKKELTDMEYRPSELDVTEVTWTLLHAFSTGLALEVSIDGSELWIHQSSSFGSRSCLVHDFWILDQSDRVGFLCNHRPRELLAIFWMGLQQQTEGGEGKENERSPLERGFQTGSL